MHPWQRDVKTSPRYTRQSWILDSTLWFPGFRYWIPEFSLSEELVFRIPVVRGIPNVELYHDSGFQSGMPDSKSKFVPDCGIWILLDEVKKKCVNRGSGKKFPCSGTTNFLVDCH